MSLFAERAVSMTEFEALLEQAEIEGRLLELIDGELVEKMPNEEHGEIVLVIGGALRDHVIPRKLGRVSTEARHRLPDDTQHSYLPDVSYIAGQRPRVTEGSIPQMPDLAVEIVSHRQGHKVLRDKANYYMAHGSKMVWIVDPFKKLVIVLTPDDEQILLEYETLSGGDLLPEFALPVKDIFADPLAE